MALGPLGAAFLLAIAATAGTEEAAAFVRFLGSEEGQRAFAGCAPLAP